MIENYVVARDFEEAFNVIELNPEKTRVIAGGTDSYLQLSKAKRASVILDITGIEELSIIRCSDDFIEIGAAVTLTEARETPWLKDEAPSLIEAIQEVASLQIRNQGTVVGNILTGRAAGGVRVCAVTFEATLVIRGPEGERELAIGGMPGSDSFKLQRDEIVTSLRIPRRQETRISSYLCSKPRKGFAYPSVSVAVSLAIDDQKFEKVRMAVSPILPSASRAGMKPCETCGGTCKICKVRRLPELEQELEGSSVAKDSIAEACEAYDWELLPIRDSLVNGSAELRRQVIKTLSRRALVKTVERYSK